MASNLELTVMRKVAWRLVPFLSLAYLINVWTGSTFRSQR